MATTRSKVGRYEIIKHLASGGMADLLLARASGIGGFERHVAIKQIRDTEAGDEDFVKMFLAEARLSAALHHQNIIQVHDIGEEHGRPYFAMEYVHGEDLRTILKKLRDLNQQPALHNVIAIGVGAATALHHAHEQLGVDRKPLGIVHRDISPGNILVGYDGSTKVADFGIAKAALCAVVTQAGILKGKVPYMAPEQCLGNGVDRRSDVFSLGIVLYELTTVRRLFKAPNDYEIMRMIVHGDVPRPSLKRPDLPAGLQAVLLKALARSPDDRYQTADEMRAALEAVAGANGLVPSLAGLAEMMRQLFGRRDEPWLIERSDSDEATVIVDFDPSEQGVASSPEISSKPEKLDSDSLMEQARSRTAPRLAQKLPPPLPTRQSAPVVAAAPVVEEPSIVIATEQIPEKRDPSSTAIVKPLPVPRAGDEESLVDASVAGARRRTWLIGGGIAGAVALIAIVVAIASSGGVDSAPSAPAPAVEPPRAAEVAPVAPPPRPVEPTPEPVQKPEPVPVEPAPEPVAVAPDPAPPGPTAKPPVHRPAAHPVVKPPPKPPKPPKPPPAYDPDALFLKKK